MSHSRVVLVIIQAAFNELACTPPNPTPVKGMYHTDQLYIFQIAPLILRIHQLILRLCTAFEILFFLMSLPEFAALSPYTSLASLSAHPSLRTMPLFVAGVIAVVLGASIWLSCFHALGEFFTFYLTIHLQHRLITSGLYRYRHPTYTGSLMIIAGLVFSHLSPGSWLWECGPLHLALCSGLIIGTAEDKQMRALFPDEWDSYAAASWFIPWVV
ncbi:hypothetical protein B0H10DRAFT_2165220 [Mycena sp. CBHHK59/15]|nr:hypothetical protein B0H10DRAFT_2165220 [Mycena sp. CBHHK59/15]